MSEAFEGIWFPIANNHHLHNRINDQAADIIQPAINPHEMIPDKSGANRKPPIRFPIANDHQSHNPITARLADSNKPIINLHETSPTNRQKSIRPGYWFPFGSQAKADLVDGYTQPVTDRVRAGWSCHLVTILFSQLPGPRSTIISRMRTRSTGSKHFEQSLENLKDVITGQASILAFGPLTGGYDDAAIPCAAFGADNIGFPHGRNMRSDPGVCQSENLPQSN
jgi:hypothetical protein